MERPGDPKGARNSEDSEKCSGDRGAEEVCVSVRLSVPTMSRDKSGRRMQALASLARTWDFIPGALHSPGRALKWVVRRPGSQETGLRGRGGGQHYFFLFPRALGRGRAMAEPKGEVGTDVKAAVTCGPVPSDHPY